MCIWSGLRSSAEPAEFIGYILILLLELFENCAVPMKKFAQKQKTISLSAFSFLEDTNMLVNHPEMHSIIQVFISDSLNITYRKCTYCSKFCKHMSMFLYEWMVSNDCLSDP